MDGRAIPVLCAQVEPRNIAYTMTLSDDSAHAKNLKCLRKRCNALRAEYGGEYDPSRVANYKKEQNRKRAEAQARRKATQQKK